MPNPQPTWVCRHIDCPSTSFTTTEAHVRKVSRSPLAVTTDDAVRWGDWVFVKVPVINQEKRP